MVKTNSRKMLSKTGGSQARGGRKEGKGQVRWSHLLCSQAFEMDRASESCITQKVKCSRVRMRLARSMLMARQLEVHTAPKLSSFNRLP